MEQPWTIRRVLAWTAKDFEQRGIESARLDAELIVAHALGLSRVALYMDLDRPLTESERGAIRDLVKRRRQREPVAYIVGHKEFWGRRFEVSPAVLVPRPDTETLVERALAILPQESDARVLDLCTGSGIIGLTLAAERKALRADLTDLSEDALAVARRNAEALGVAERVRFFSGDLFAPLPEGSRYALVTANPPYVAEGELASLAPDVREHEPRLALAGGEDGFAVHRRIVAGAPRFLEPGGTILVEVGAGQAEALEAMLAARPEVEATARHRDLGGIERVVEARLRA
ncbi:MAG TPA: peptide chain release factor N(5)-glutamine methyltransferase [Sandaracinaceae bacterium]